MDISTSNLSKSQRKIADYLHKNEQDIPYMTEREIARYCGVSVPTVSRFWNAIGHKNLKEFKRHQKREVFATPASKLQTAVDKYDTSYLETMLEDAIHHLSMTIEHISSSDLESAMNELIQADRIHLYGSGSAKSLIDLMSFRLQRLNLQVRILAPSGHEIFEDMLHMNSKDILVIFGFVQSSPEIDVLFDFAEREGLKTILMTDLLYSPLLERANYVLYTSRGEATDFHSMVAPIALIEMCIIQISKKLGEEGMMKLHKLHELRKRYQNRLPKK